MINKKLLIDEINKGCKLLFDSSFHLKPSTVNRFRITGNQSSKALNNYKSIKEEINVIKWFDIFWIYLEITFVEENTFISLSVFQGEQSDDAKNQLFRAEWDDYNNEDEKHPQPHWHITSNQSIENTFKEYTDTFENEGFAELLKEEKTKIIDVNKIHFAMNGNWINDDTHIQSISDNSKIVKWFQGLFSHLRVQLEYVNK